MAITTQNQLLYEIQQQYERRFNNAPDLRDILNYMAQNGAQSPCRVLEPDVTLTFESDGVSNPSNPYTGAEIEIAATGALPGKTIILVHTGTSAPDIIPLTGITIVNTEGQYYATEPATPNYIAFTHLDGGKVRVQYLTGQASLISLSGLGGQPKTLSVNTKTENYTLSSNDAGAVINMNLESAGIITLPPNDEVELPVGFQVIISQQGAGAITITPDTGVTIRSAGGKTKLADQYSTCSLIKIATNTWQLQGDLITTE